MATPSTAKLQHGKVTGIMIAKNDKSVTVTRFDSSFFDRNGLEHWQAKKAGKE